MSHQQEAPVLAAGVVHPFANFRATNAADLDLQAWHAEVINDDFGEQLPVSKAEGWSALEVRISGVTRLPGTEWRQVARSNLVGLITNRNSKLGDKDMDVVLAKVFREILARSPVFPRYLVEYTHWLQKALRVHLPREAYLCAETFKNSDKKGSGFRISNFAELNIEIRLRPWGSDVNAPPQATQIIAAVMVVEDQYRDLPAAVIAPHHLSLGKLVAFISRPPIEFRFLTFRRDHIAWIPPVEHGEQNIQYIGDDDNLFRNALWVMKNSTNAPRPIVFHVFRQEFNHQQIFG